MVYLLLIILFIQSIFYWFLKPAIFFSTPIFELRGFGCLVLLALVWLISGRSALSRK